jgi:ankyrin repeat protein
VEKRGFIKAVRSWDSKIVARAVGNDPGLARYVDQIGKTPLHHCAEIDSKKFGLNTVDSLATAKALIKAGADVNSVRIIIDDGEEFAATPLWYAVAWGKNLPLVQLLTDSGAHPDDNAIGSAIWDQSQEMAELIRSRGGQVDHKFRGDTPLLRTIKSKRYRLLSWLVENGADINARDAAGYTALHFAAKGNHNLAQIGELLSLGAKPGLKAKDGSTPLSIAKANDKQKLSALLMKST